MLANKDVFSGDIWKQGTIKVKHDDINIKFVIGYILLCIISYAYVQDKNTVQYMNYLIF